MLDRSVVAFRSESANLVLPSVPYVVLNVVRVADRIYLPYCHGIPR